MRNLLVGALSLCFGMVAIPGWAQFFAGATVLSIPVADSELVAGFQHVEGHNGTKGWYLCEGDDPGVKNYGVIPPEAVEQSNFDFLPFICERASLLEGSSVVGFMPSVRLRGCDADNSGLVSRMEAKACWDCEADNPGQVCLEMTQAYPLTPVYCLNYGDSNGFCVYK